LSPRKHVPKTYRALVAGDVGAEDADLFTVGVTLDDGYVTMPAQLQVLARTKSGTALSAEGQQFAAEMTKAIMLVPHNQEEESQTANMPLSWIELTIHEGKFHQVKRMFEAVGKKVLYLRRISMGPLQLDPALSPGEWRELTEEEIESLRNFRKDGNG
jgi:16S rRNA pseudouridine516 synthase